VDCNHNKSITTKFNAKFFVVIRVTEALGEIHPIVVLLTRKRQIRLVKGSNSYSSGTSHWWATSILIIRPESYDIEPNIVAKTYGFCLKRGMSYGLLRTYEFFHRNTRPPSWWTRKSMGYKGLWVIRGMRYEGFDCMSSECGERTLQRRGLLYFGYERVGVGLLRWNIILRLLDADQKSIALYEVYCYPGGFRPRKLMRVVTRTQPLLRISVHQLSTMNSAFGIGLGWD